MTSPQRRWPPRSAALLVAAGLLAAPASLLAQAGGPRVFVVDPARSQVRFQAFSRFVDAAGTFGRVSGEIRLDEARPDTASGRITVDVASLDTRNRLRDDHLRSADFFDVEHHPTATFVSSTVERDGDRWRVTGQLTVRGVTRALTVPVSVSRAGAGVRVAGDFTVNRQDFGIAYTSFLNPIRNEARVVFDLLLVPR